MNKFFTTVRRHRARGTVRSSVMTTTSIMNNPNNFGKFFRICLEGNIGCGKTSMLNLLLDRYPSYHYDGYDKNSDEIKKFPTIQFEDDIPMVISSEPIQQWTKLPIRTDPGRTENLLEKMYQDPTRWAFVFEHYCQFTRFQQMSSVVDHFKRSAISGLHLMERSIFSNRFCFIENFHLTEMIPDPEYHVLDAWFEHLKSKPDAFIDLFMYLRTDPETVHKRIVSRARNEEEAIPLKYLQDIHCLHEKAFVDKLPSIWMKMPENAAVIIVDANQPLNSVFEDFVENLKNWPTKLMKHSESKIEN